MGRNPRRWRLLASLLLLALAGTLVAPAGAATKRSLPRGCTAQRCVTVHIPAPRGVNVTDDRAVVMLPLGYATSHRRYPVVYLFNGVIGPFDEWVIHTDIADYSRQFDAIFVDFAAGDGPGAGFFSDWLDGTYQWETYHVGTVIPWINQHFRTLPNDAAAIGVSLGATGALNYAEHHPGLFRTVGTFSGLVDTQALTPLSGYDMQQSYPTITRVWGNQVTESATWAAHNPTVGAANLAGTQLFVASGTGSPDPTSADIHGKQQEANIWTDHPTFMTALAVNRVKHRDNFYLGGEHGWAYFVPDLHWALPQMMAILATPSGSTPAGR